MTYVARPVLVQRATCSTTDPINVLVAFGRMLAKVDSGSKHASNVGVSFIETFLYYGVDERGAVKQHPLVALVAVLFGNLLSPMIVTLPELSVLNFLDL